MSAPAPDGLRPPTLVLAVALALVAALVRLRPLRSLDLWWHLSMGKAVLAGKGRVVEDPTSFTPDQPYADPEWLFDVLALGVWEAAGVPGVILATALLAGVSALLTWWLARRVGLGAWTAVVVAALAVGGASWRFDPRPQSVFLVLLPLVMLLAVSARRSGGRTRWGYLVGLVVACGVWSQCHSSMVIAPVVVVPLALHRWQDSDRFTPAQIGLLGLLLFVPFLGPHGFGVVQQIVAHSGSDAAKHITDMRPMPWYGWIPRPGNSMMFIEIMLGAAIVGGIRKRRFPLALVALAVLGLAMTVTAHRFRAAWALMLVPLVADLLAGDHQEGPWHRRLATATPFLLALALWWGEPGPSLRWDRSSVPVDATEAMETLGTKGRIFNDYDGGGWIGWSMAPGVQVFIDGRTPTFFDSEHYFAARQAWASRDAFEGLDAEHHFDMVLALRDDPLCAHLTGDGDWDVVWFGEKRALFLPSGTAPALVVLTPCGVESNVARCSRRGDPTPYLSEVDRLIELGQAEGYPARLGAALGLLCPETPDPSARRYLDLAREADASHPDIGGFEEKLGSP